MSYILAIESSCDDTSCAVINSDFHVLSNVTASQKVHQEYGGVVPELASRAHQSNIVPVVDKALKDAKINKQDLSAVAFTRGPGLLGSLLVGVCFAKSFATALNIPLIEVNHLEAHVLAHFIKDSPEQNVPSFPFLCLLVSGGNTQIILLEGPRKMKTIGKTIDDAAGETIDKAAKILSLPYPGGPHIDRLAKEGNVSLKFSQSHIPGYDYSLAASVQKAVVDTLLAKFEKAIKDTGIKTIAVAGGVSANSELRERLTLLGNKHGCRVFIPKFSYTTDNAAMVGCAGLFKYFNKEFASLDLTAYTR